MIQSFKDDTSRDIYNGVSSKDALRIPASLWRTARRKLDALDGAFELFDLQAPPGNRLEKLRGRFEGHYSIRINDQYRIVFRWTGNDAYEVQITDYH